jgi:chemotaxis protein histidine kinase CheA
MALDDKDREEIKGIVGELFGVEKGKSVLEALGSANEEQINAILNKYDKRKAKDGEKLSETLKTITETLDGLKRKPEDDDDADPDDKPGDKEKPSKKGAESPEVKALRQEQRKLTERLEAAEKVNKEEKAAREALEAKQAARAQTDAVRAAAIAKEVGVDPEKIDLLLDHIAHRNLVKLNEAGTGYEIQIGVDKSGEPIVESLSDGLAKFVKTNTGKFFLPAVPGAGGGGGGGGGSKPGAGGAAPITAEQLATMKPSDIEKMAGAGNLQIS